MLIFLGGKQKRTLRRRKKNVDWYAALRSLYPTALKLWTLILQ